MSYLKIGLCLLASIALASGNSCKKLPSGSDVDKTVTQHKWYWVEHSNDLFSDSIQCSGYSIKQKGKKVTMDLRYGSFAHQVYNMKAHRVSPGVYKLPAKFTSSWLNIVSYVHGMTKANRFLAAINKKYQNRLVFYTDGKTYLITVMCLPQGDAVWVHSRKKNVGKHFMKTVKKELKKQGITAKMIPTNCPEGRTSAAKKS